MKKTKAEKIIFGVIFVIFFLYAVFLLLPLAYGFNISLLKDPSAFVKNRGALSYPPYFGNYISAFREFKIGDTTFIGMLINSIWYAFGTTILALFSSSMAAYVVAKYKFRGRHFIYVLSLVVMIIPIYGALPAQYSLLHDLHLLNSPAYLLSATGGFGFNFLILYSFFSTLSWSYAEAAFIDGASNASVFFRIMLPMALPSITAVGIMAIVGAWNDYETPYLFLRDMPPLASSIYENEKIILEKGGNAPVYFAAAFLASIPMLIIFAVFQNTIMQHVYAGGLKG